MPENSAPDQTSTDSKAAAPNSAEAVSKPSPTMAPTAAAHSAPPAPPRKKKAEGVLVKKPGQWVCLVKDEKGKNCEGKLKRYYDLDSELIRQFGKKGEIYRCMKCHTLYRPENPSHDPAARWVEV